MDKKARIKLTLLTEETVSAVEKSLQALDAILAEVFQSATGADEKLLRTWAGVLGRTSRNYLLSLQEEHVALLQIMAVGGLSGSINRDEMINAMNAQLKELEETDD